MKKTQRLILAVIVPLVVLSIAVKIISAIIQQDALKFIVLTDVDESWWVWAITFAFIGLFEYFLFRDGRKG